jgi:hypothetical protein
MREKERTQSSEDIIKIVYDLQTRKTASKETNSNGTF